MLRRLKREVNKLSAAFLEFSEEFSIHHPIVGWVMGGATLALFLGFLFGQNPVLGPQQPAEIIAEQRVLQIMGFILCLLLLLIQHTPFVAKAIAFVVAVRGVPPYQDDEKYIFWGILAVVLFFGLAFLSSPANDR